MFRTALRNVLAHKGRLLMTALAVMLGTAFMAGTMVFSDTLGQAMKSSLSKSYTDVSVLVTDNDAGLKFGPKSKSDHSTAKLTDATVKQLAALPGAARARGLVEGFTGVADKKGDLIGEAWTARGANFAPDASGQDTRYPITQGQGPKNAGEIALDEQTAKTGGYHVGDKVRIATNGPASDKTLSGIFTTTDPEVTSGGTLALFDNATAQSVLLTPGQYSGIAVLAKPGTSQTELQDQVTGKLPSEARFIAQTGKQLSDQSAEAVTKGTSFLKTILLVFAGIALFVGIFIIVNTFTMLVSQRTKELALLRAVGASRGQVTKSVLAEALVIGTVASVAGLLAGVGIGAGAQALIHSLTPSMPTGALVIAPVTIVAALLVGILVTVFSAWIPARRASRIPPVAAMSSGDQPASQKSLLIRNILGLVITGGGLGVIMLGVAAGKDGRYTVGGGAAIALIGLFVLLPLLSRPVIALVGPALGALAGTPGKLARLNAVRNPRRTAATAAALTIGLTLVSCLTVLGASVNDAVDRAVTSSMKADYLVSSERVSLSPELAATIAKAPGIAAASPMNNAYWQINGADRAISGVDADSFTKLLQVKLDSGSADALAKGQVLVQSDTAAKNHLAVGSTLDIAYPSGDKGTVTVGGVFDKAPMLSTVVMANSELAKHEEEPYLSGILVKAADGPSSSAKQAIKDATGNNPVIQVKTKSDMQQEFSSAISVALNMMYGLLGMSVLVAVLGVINTLAMSVWERKREIGMLRAIGMDRRGIKRMVRLESVMISMFGAALGVVFGCFVAWAANSTLKSSIDGLSTVIPYGQLLLFLVLAGLVGLVAALWPARRAAKLDILASIKTD